MQATVEYLVIQCLCEPHNNLIVRLTKALYKCNATILDSRFTHLGALMNISMLVSGSWDTLVKLEHAHARMQQELGVSLTFQRTQAYQPNSPAIAYKVEINTIDKPGVMYQLTNFFNRKGIHIADIYSESYLNSRTQTRMFRMCMVLDINEKVALSGLRDAFVEYCEDKNLDAYLTEPQHQAL